LNSFTLSPPKWGVTTNARGIITRSVLINDGLPQNERLEKLNQVAIQQMQVLEGVKKLADS